MAFLPSCRAIITQNVVGDFATSLTVFRFSQNCDKSVFGFWQRLNNYSVVSWADVGGPDNCSRRVGNATAYLCLTAHR